MKSENSLLAVAIISVLIVTLSMGITYYSVNSFKHNVITAFATTTSNGTVTINVNTTVSINFTTNVINWSIGAVNPSVTQATLETTGATGTVTNGTWTAQGGGFILRNIGNVNVSLTLQAGKNATTFIGGTNPSYQYNVTNFVANSCITTDQNIAFGSWQDANSTVRQICSKFRWEEDNDRLRIDVLLVVPYSSTTGYLADQFQATGTSI